MKNQSISWICLVVLVWAAAFFAGPVQAENNTVSTATFQDQEEHPESEGHGGEEHPEGEGHDGEEHPEGEGHDGEEHPEGEGHDGEEHPEGEGHDGEEHPEGDDG